MPVDFLRSRVFIFGSLLFLLFTLSLWGREVYNEYQIEKEINSLEKDINMLESRNQELQSLIQYFETVEYQERQARSVLNLQKPGEFAVAFPNRDEQVASAEIKNDGSETVSNFEKWWQYFFASSG